MIHSETLSIIFINWKVQEDDDVTKQFTSEFTVICYFLVSDELMQIGWYPFLKNWILIMRRYSELKKWIKSKVDQFGF